MYTCITIVIFSLDVCLYISSGVSSLYYKLSLRRLCWKTECVGKWVFIEMVRMLLLLESQRTTAIHWPNCWWGAIYTVVHILCQTWTTYPQPKVLSPIHLFSLLVLPIKKPENTTITTNQMAVTSLGVDYLHTRLPRQECGPLSSQPATVSNPQKASVRRGFVALAPRHQQYPSSWHDENQDVKGSRSGNSPYGKVYTSIVYNA